MGTGSIGERKYQETTSGVRDINLVVIHLSVKIICNEMHIINTYSTISF